MCEQDWVNCWEKYLWRPRTRCCCSVQVNRMLLPAGPAAPKPVDPICFVSGRRERHFFLFFSFFFFSLTFAIDWEEHRPICLDLFCHTSCITLCSHTATYGRFSRCSCVNMEQIETNEGEPCLGCDGNAWLKSCAASTVKEMAWFIGSSICERVIIKLKVQSDGGD